MVKKVRIIFEVLRYLNERLVVCNEEDTDGRIMVTTDDERDIDQIVLVVVRLAGHENFIGE